MNDDRWTESKLRTLEPHSDWTPNGTAALGMLQRRKRRARPRRIGLLWASATVAALCAGVLWMPVSGSCAPPPASCERRLWQKMFRSEPVPEPRMEPLPRRVEPAPEAHATPEPAPKAAPVAHPHPPAPLLDNYKETGADTATIVCEVYFDYQCPPCAAFHRDVLPQLIAEYVETGKVKLRHRDFPLRVHTHARDAARYADAAGRLGYYNRMVNRIFTTQPQWSADGDIDGAVAPAVPAQAMRKIRDLIEHDSTLDKTLDEDIHAGHEDQLRQTPSVVITAKGRRQLLPGTPSFSLLKSYLDQLLAEQ